MPHVIVIANSDKPRASELADQAEMELTRLGADVDVSLDRQDALVNNNHYDLAVVFGGDGTVLNAIAGLGVSTPEIVAFNVGHLGYLAENSPDSLHDVLRGAMAGTLSASRRIMIEAEVVRPDAVIREYALNEFVLSQRMSGRMLPVSIKVDEEQLMQFRGDGIILCTPTGSTAYSLSAGGPVASPEMEAIIMTPLCPHQLANRSLILNPTETVRIHHHSDMAAALMADGRFCFELEGGEEVAIRVSSRRVTFLSLPRGAYTLLRDKLGWGWQNQAFR